MAKTTALSLLTFSVFFLNTTLSIPCNVIGSKEAYFDYPFLRNISGKDHLCMHMTSNTSIRRCSGGCGGYFSHEPVYTLGNEKLDILANNSCSGEKTRCCRAFSSHLISVELTFACVDLMYLNRTPLYLSMLDARYIFQEKFDLFEFQYGNYHLMTEVAIQEEPTSCNCGNCYGPSGVNETICHNLSQPPKAINPESLLSFML